MSEPSRARLAPIAAAVLFLLHGTAMAQATQNLKEVTVSADRNGATALGLCIAAPFWGKRFDAQSPTTVLSQVEWICWACAAIVAVQATSHELTLFVLARVLWGVCLAALLPVFYGLLSREADAQHQGRVLGAGNSAAKAGALVGAGAGGLILAWIPIQYAFWPVVAIYAMAAIGLRLIRQNRSAATAAGHSTAA